MARITFPRTRALIAGVLFVSWIGYLAHLVSITRGTIPLAGPQIQTADVVILAEVTDELGRGASEVRVKEVLHATGEKKPEVGAKIVVDDLLFCGPKQGYRGAGSYVIPLKRALSGSTYRVKMLPIVPGYYAPTSECEVSWGIDKESVAKTLSRVTGVPAARIERLFQAKADLKEKGVVVPNLPFYFLAAKDRKDSQDDIVKFQEDIAKAGGGVASPAEPGESRIYWATPTAIEETRVLLR